MFNDPANLLGLTISRTPPQWSWLKMPIEFSSVNDFVKQVTIAVIIIFINIIGPGQVLKQGVRLL